MRMFTDILVGCICFVGSYCAELLLSCLYSGGETGGLDLQQAGDDRNDGGGQQQNADLNGYVWSIYVAS